MSLQIWPLCLHLCTSPGHMTCCVKVIAVCIVQIGKIPVCCFNVEFICWQGGFYVNFQHLSLRLFSHVLNKSPRQIISTSLDVIVRSRCPTGLLSTDMSGCHCIHYWPSFHKTFRIMHAMEVPFQEGPHVIKSRMMMASNTIPWLLLVMAKNGVSSTGN